MDEQSVAEQEQQQKSQNGVASPTIENKDEMQLETPNGELVEDEATTKHGYKTLFSLHGHKRSVSSLAISPDGQQLASSGVDGLLKLWSLATGAMIATLDAALASDEEDETARLRLGVSDVAWSKDGQYLVSGGDDCIVRVWDAVRRTLVRQFAGHTSYVFCVNLHPNTSLAVSGSFDETVRLWNLQRNTCHRVISAHSEAVTAVDFNTDGSMLASSSYDGQIRLWDSYTGQCLKTLVSEGDKISNSTIGIGDIKFSPNSFQLLATSLDHTIRLWDIANARVVKTYQGHQNEKYAIKACFTAYKNKQNTSTFKKQKGRQDGKDILPELMIVAGSENYQIHLWDLQSRKVVQTLPGHRDAVISIATHPSIKVIASASLDRDPTIRVRRCFSTSFNMLDDADSLLLLESPGMDIR